jgi:hypothetical protein
MTKIAAAGQGDTVTGAPTTTTTTPAPGTPAAGEAGATGTPAAAAAGTPATTTPVPAPAAPAKYELTVPENSLLEPSDLAAIEAIAREAQMPNDEAQALVERQHVFQVEQSQKFASILKADKDYGGDQLAQTQARARQAIDRVRPEGHPRRAAFMRILDKTGYGNHVEIASYFADLGKLMGEDTTFGGTTSAGEKSVESRLYKDA